MSDSERLRSFMRNLAKASKKRKEQHKSRQELSKHIDKVKTLAEKKGTRKSTITKALKELEKKIEQVIENEKQSAVKSEGISSELKSMKQKFNSFTTKDIQIIDSLQKKISDLENRRTQQIDNAVSMLQSRLEELESRKEDRDKKIIELEKKIKERVHDNFLELMKIEKNLEQMEIKYKKMKREGKHDKETLRTFKDKIEGAKHSLHLKKQNIMDQQMEKGEPLPEPPKPKVKKMPRTKSKGLIRHDIKFKPADTEKIDTKQFEKNVKSAEEESFEDILNEEHIPVIRLRRERPKKKGFWKKLFG